MSRIIQARIDEETETLLSQLQLRLGWNDSQIVRDFFETEYRENTQPSTFVELNRPPARGVTLSQPKSVHGSST